MSKLMLDATKDRNLHAATVTRQPSQRWIAPELLSGPKVYDFPCDTWSFAMLMIELFTRQHPYPEYRRDIQVLHVVLSGQQPERPVDNKVGSEWVSDAVWELMENCWEMVPAKRPDMAEVRDRVAEAKVAYVKPPPPPPPEPTPEDLAVDAWLADFSAGKIIIC
jgi:hypothetical protein